MLAREGGNQADTKASSLASTRFGVATLGFTSSRSF